jgi:ribosomal protein L11 methyltransferase
MLSTIMNNKIKAYLQISISATEAQQEMLLPTMIELGCEGFEQIESALICYLKYDSLNKKSEYFKNEIQQLIQHISSNALIEIKVIEETNWNADWEKTIQPIEIGKRFVVKPTWSEYNNLENRIILHIDPKMSFGTGYHETTRLTLQLLESFMKINDKVLDVGTGTGILAIAAIKLGAQSSVGIDNDDWSIENAQENIRLNDVTSQIQINKKELQEFNNESFDMITANLTLNTNIEMMKDFYRLLRNRGKIILSGLLVTDQPKMEEHLIKNSFQIVERLFENEWIAIAAQKM